MSIDFGFLFARVMRFYGLSFSEMMALPIRTFWLLDDMVDRVRSEELLDFLPVYATSMAGGKELRTVIEALKSKKGVPIVTAQYGIKEEDKAKLSKLFG